MNHTEYEVIEQFRTGDPAERKECLQRLMEEYLRTAGNRMEEP